MKIDRKELLFTNIDIWRLVWPLLIEQILQITLGMADIFMVSSLGEVAVSGVSLVDQINVLLTQIFAALGTGGAVVCSQYIGAKKLDMSKDTSKQLLISVFYLSAAITAVLLVSYKWILRITFGSITPEVMTAAQKYFLVSLFAIPGIALYNAAASLFRAAGNSRISMIIATLVNIVNIGGNALFIYGLKWGVEGVALPTFISRTLAAIILLLCLYFSKKEETKTLISIKGIFKSHLNFKIIKRIMKIGIPNVLENSSFQFGKILVLNVCAYFGTTAIAANAAGNTLASFEIIPGSALGMAMLTVVGQCVGAGKNDQAVYYTKKLMLLSYLGFLAVNIPFLSSSYAILKLYGLGEETTKLAWLITMTHGVLGIFFWSTSFTLPNALRAANDASYTMIVSTITMWTVRVGLAYLFKYTHILGLMEYLNWPFSYGALSVWFAMVIDWLVRSAFFITRFAGGKWKTKTSL